MTTASTDLDPRFLDYPSLSFWYGLSASDLATMPRWLKRVYYEELPSLLAQRQLLNIESAAWPHMADDARNQALSALQEKAESGREETQAPTKDMAPAAYELHMAHAGIPVQFVDADGNPVSMGPPGTGGGRHPGSR